MLIELTDENFEEGVVESSGLVLVDFWAPWCVPCQAMGPVIEELAEDYEGELKVAKLNVDENREAAEAYGIMSIPTLILFEEGEQVEQLVGIQPRENIVETVEEYL